MTEGVYTGITVWARSGRDLGFAFGINGDGYRYCLYCIHTI